jgi:beta-lactam-binding protein with PASTA domain
VQIPRLVGFSVPTAESMLARVGLRVGIVSQQPSTAFAGTVVRTDPPPYTTVLPGTRVDLVVAAG